MENEAQKEYFQVSMVICDNVFCTMYQLSIRSFEFYRVQRFKYSGAGYCIYICNSIENQTR